MGFEKKFTAYLVENEGYDINKRCDFEFTRIKNYLNICRHGKQNRASIGSQGDANLEDDREQMVPHPKCPRCDRMFSELTLTSSKMADYLSLRVEQLAHLHFTPGMSRFLSRLFQCFQDDQEQVTQRGLRLIKFAVMNAIALRKILKKYDKVHDSTRGMNFRSKLQGKHLDILQSPWLLELVAFYINLHGSDSLVSSELVGLLSFNLDVTSESSSLTLKLLGFDKLEYSLICPICLDVVFQPHALSCGHIFCKSCACLAANVLIIEGLKYASPGSKCPVCRESGVFDKSVCMSEMGFLLQQRYTQEFKERIIEERKKILKQTKEFWELQTSSMMGL